MNNNSKPTKITLMSFGFKYGLPNANYYFDVAFMRNPAREKKWSFFSAPNEEMVKYVLEQDKAKKFIEKVIPLLLFLAEVDQNQVFAFGCNAGRHRSSILVEELQRRLREHNIESKVVHRDNDGLNQDSIPVEELQRRLREHNIESKVVRKNRTK